jgi:hypothetical protein
METLIIIVVALLAGFAGWYLHGIRGTEKIETKLPQPALPTPPERCRTITYYYSDGSSKSYHSCQGHHEFTDRFGRRFAPKGTTLIRSVGGVHV